MWGKLGGRRLGWSGVAVPGMGLCRSHRGGAGC